MLADVTHCFSTHQVVLQGPNQDDPTIFRQSL